MSGDKPIYNPEGLSEEELKAEEEAAAAKQTELNAKLMAKMRERREAPSQPRLGKPKETIRSGLGVHHEGRVLPQGSRDRRDKNEIEEDREAVMESLKNKIREVLKSYKLHNVFKFKITVSDKDREKHVFKLLENYKTTWEVEDRLENMPNRLEEYLKVNYADRLP